MSFLKLVRTSSKKAYSAPKGSAVADQAGGGVEEFQIEVNNQSPIVGMVVT